MKTLMYALAMAVLFTGCKKKQAETVSSYPNIVVGVVEGGSAKPQNEALLKQQWQKKSQVSGLTIVSFEVVKSKTTDDTAIEFYMLLAKTKEGPRLAALLAEKNGQLFFDDKSNTITMCRSKLGENISINGISNGERIHLYCGGCAGCEKIELGI